MSEHDEAEIERRREENRKRQEFDQGLANLGDTLPPIWYRIHQNLILTGFDQQQAMQVLLAYVHGFAGGKFSV